MYYSIIKQVAHYDRNDGSQQNGIVAHSHRTGGSFERRLFMQGHGDQIIQLSFHRLHMAAEAACYFSRYSVFTVYTKCNRTRAKAKRPKMPCFQGFPVSKYTKFFIQILLHSL